MKRYKLWFVVVAISLVIGVGLGALVTAFRRVALGQADALDMRPVVVLAGLGGLLLLPFVFRAIDRAKVAR